MKSNGMTFPCKPQSSMHHNGFAKCALPGLTLLQGLAHCHFWQRRKKLKFVLVAITGSIFQTYHRCSFRQSYHSNTFPQIDLNSTVCRHFQENFCFFPFPKFALGFPYTKSKNQWFFSAFRCVSCCYFDHQEYSIFGPISFFRFLEPPRYFLISRAFQS